MPRLRVPTAQCRTIASKQAWDYTILSLQKQLPNNIQKLSGNRQTTADKPAIKLFHYVKCGI